MGPSFPPVPSRPYRPAPGGGGGGSPAAALRPSPGAALLAGSPPLPGTAALPRHTVRLHLIRGPARGRTPWTREVKLGKLQAPPGARPRALGRGAARPAAGSAPCRCGSSRSAGEPALREASGRQAANGKLRLFVLTSSGRGRGRGGGSPCFAEGSFPLGGSVCLQLPAAPPALPALPRSILCLCSTIAGLIFQKILHKQLKC